MYFGLEDIVMTLVWHKQKVGGKTIYHRLVVKHHPMYTIFG